MLLQVALDDAGGHIRGDQFVETGVAIMAHLHHDVPALDAPPAHQLHVQGAQFVKGPLLQGSNKGVSYGFGFFQAFAWKGEDINLNRSILGGPSFPSSTSAGADHGIQLEGHRFGQTFPAAEIQLLGPAELQAMGDALGDASRYKPWSMRSMQ